MIYSCFDDRSGLYDYFEGPLQIPLNGDLPIPRFPKAAKGIGVATIEAGRPLPRGAKHVGKGWRARGMIVQCHGGKGLGDTAEWVKDGGWMWLAAGVVGLWMMGKMI